MCNNYQLTCDEYRITTQRAHPGIPDAEIERGWRELPERHKLEVKEKKPAKPKKVKTPSLFDAPAKAEPKKRKAIDHTEITLPEGPFNRWLIRKTMYAPIIYDDGGNFMPMLARWGFDRREMAQVKNPCINNTRIDALGKEIWKEAWNTRRCLIPASGIYEWRQVWGKSDKAPEQTFPFAIVPASEYPLMIAGIWEPDIHFGYCYSMLTTDAPANTQHVHDRLPLFLPQPLWEEYLFSKEPPDGLVQPFDGDLEVFPCENVLMDAWKAGPPKKA